LHSIRYYLSERFRLRFEDSGIEDMMEEETGVIAEISEQVGDNKAPVDEGIDLTLASDGKNRWLGEHNHIAAEGQIANGAIRTLDGELAGDELEGDAINYQILLSKIDRLLENLKLDA